MIDRRSLNQTSLSGTDFVLEGASVRDRFLTAFVLQHNGSLATAWPQAARTTPMACPCPGLPLSSGNEGTFEVHVPSVYEPLTVRVVDDWFGSDDDDDL